jgi:hypothetical protein
MDALGGMGGKTVKAVLGVSGFFVFAAGAVVLSLSAVALNRDIRSKDDVDDAVKSATTTEEKSKAADAEEDAKQSELYNGILIAMGGVVMIMGIVDIIAAARLK